MRRFCSTKTKPDFLKLIQFAFKILQEKNRKSYLKSKVCYFSQHRCLNMGIFGKQFIRESFHGFKKIQILESTDS